MASVIKSVQGADKIKQRLAQLKDLTALKQALVASALMVEKSAKESIAHGSPSGHVYGNHRASAPGQPPATDTGALLSSISHWVEDGGLSVEVGSKLHYAPHLEYGTKNMGARPWLTPAFEANRKAITDRLARALKIKRT